MSSTRANFRTSLHRGLVIPATPLALNAKRQLDERRQRALFRYYVAAGSGGLAVGVHTTQFAIRDPKINLFKPILEIAQEEFTRGDTNAEEPLVRIAGICGATQQATSEACLVREHGFHAGLLSLAAMKNASEDELIAHCRAVAEIIPVVGFYLQPAVGGRVLPFSFWRRFAEIENVVAIKMAPFNRYQTIDVVRAIIEAGRDDIALYTGNDDNIVLDLITPFRFHCPQSPTSNLGGSYALSAGLENQNYRNDEPLSRLATALRQAGSPTPQPLNGKTVERRIVGGLLGHWSVWTRKAVELLSECHAVRNQTSIPAEMLLRNIEVTDSNAAFFDAANGFAGCIAGLHEVLRRQGLLEGIWCLDPNEGLSRGQAEEIDRVYRSYPHLNDDAFVAEHRDEWLR